MGFQISRRTGPPTPIMKYGIGITSVGSIVAKDHTPIRPPPPSLMNHRLV